MQSIRKIKVYLAGRIPIGKERGIDPDWRHKYISQIRKVLPGAFFLDPTHREIDEKDAKAVFGHDLFLIEESDFIVVNAEVPLGAGTAQEMIIARYFQKPIITVSPPGTYYSPNTCKKLGKNIYCLCHPFLVYVSDYVIYDISEIKSLLGKLSKRKGSIKWDLFLKEAINYYLGNYFEKDNKTREMLAEAQK